MRCSPAINPVQNFRDRPWFKIASFAALITALDQATKYLAVTQLKPLRSIEVIPGFFNLSYVENPGAAWGILDGHKYPLIIFSVISLIFIAVKRHQLFGHLKFPILLPSLICGGIVGNLIDRIRIARVIDFLDFHAFGRHFPAFNIADSAICIGAFLFVLAEFLHTRQSAPAEARAQQASDATPEEETPSDRGGF
jgi:signal peptidase II